MPSRKITRYVPNLRDIQVVIFDDGEGVYPSSVLQFIREEMEVGLVLMGLEFDNNGSASVIILTTREVFYVFKPDCEDDINFLRELLDTPELVVHMSASHLEFVEFKRKFNINLNHVNADIICTFGRHARQLLYADILTSLYPMKVRKYMSELQRPRYEPFQKLVEMWLDVPPETISYNEDSLNLLDFGQLSDEVIDTIKKRCCLVTILSRVIEYYGEMLEEVFDEIDYEKV